MPGLDQRLSKERRVLVTEWWGLTLTTSWGCPVTRLPLLVPPSGSAELQRHAFQIVLVLFDRLEQAWGVIWTPLLEAPSNLAFTV